MDRNEAVADELRQVLAEAIGPACHELRSPLAVVYGFARMLQGKERELAAAGLDARWIDSIVGGSERLDALLDDLSRIGRICAGRVHPEAGHADVEAAIAEAIDGLGEWVSYVGPPDQVVRADHAWLVEAVSGVVRALRYDDGVRVRIDAHRTQTGSELVFSTGPESLAVATETSAAVLSLNHARVMVLAMGGSFHNDERSIRIALHA